MGNFINKLDNYQVMPRELIFDNTLSDRARFVYCYMASKPNGWDFYLEPMAREIGYSVDTLRKYINELVKSGWLTKGEQEHVKGNRFGAVSYTLNEILPTRKNTDTEISRDGENPTLIEKRYIRKKRDKEIKDLSFVSLDFKEVFADWLEYKKDRKESYKSDKSIKACYNKLVKLSGNNPETARQIVEQSMANNWAGLFALKIENNGNNRSNYTSKQEANDYAMQLLMRDQERINRGESVYFPSEEDRPF